MLGNTQTVHLAPNKPCIQPAALFHLIDAIPHGPAGSTSCPASGSTAPAAHHPPSAAAGTTRRAMTGAPRRGTARGAAAAGRQRTAKTAVAAVVAAAGIALVAVEAAAAAAATARTAAGATAVRGESRQSAHPTLCGPDRHRDGGARRAAQPQLRASDMAVAAQAIEPALGASTARRRGGPLAALAGSGRCGKQTGAQRGKAAPQPATAMLPPRLATAAVSSRRRRRRGRGATQGSSSRARCRSAAKEIASAPAPASWDLLPTPPNLVTRCPPRCR